MYKGPFINPARSVPGVHTSRALGHNGKNIKKKSFSSKPQGTELIYFVGSNVSWFFINLPYPWDQKWPCPEKQIEKQMALIGQAVSA